MVGEDHGVSKLMRKKIEFLMLLSLSILLYFLKLC